MVLTERSERIRTARKLTRRAGREKAGLLLAEGAQAVREAVHLGPSSVVEVFVAPAARGRHPDIVRAADQRGITVRDADDAALAALSETVTPQGIVAVCRSVVVSLDDVLGAGAGWHDAAVSATGATRSHWTVSDAAPANARGPRAAARAAGAGALRLVTVLVSARDPGNVGTVIRCSDAAGADAVVLTHGSVDPEGGKAVRASAGSLFHLPVAVGAPVEQVVDELRAAGLTVLAADGDAEQDLDEAEDDGVLSRPTAWLFGNEAWGLPSDVRGLADHVVRVPIYGQAESLNLATAAAVCLYGSARAQRLLP